MNSKKETDKICKKSKSKKVQKRKEVKKLQVGNVCRTCDFFKD